MSGEGSWAVRGGGFASSLRETVRVGVGGKSAEREEAAKLRVAEEFASLLFFEMIKALRATVPQGGLWAQDSLAHDVYTTLADMEIARSMARQQGVGLVGYVERALAAYDRAALYALPVDGVVSSPFGLRQDPLGGGQRVHEGIDIAASSGSPIRALAAGRIVFSGWVEGYGNLVAIDHGNGMVTRYAHTEANLVSVGEEVVAGQNIALVGSSGRATGPHLHLEVLQDGRPIDPRSFLTLASSAKHAGR